MNYKSFCNTEIVFSNKEELQEKLLFASAVNVVLVMSESSALRWNMMPFIEKLQDKCQALNGTVTWIKTVAANPIQRDVIKSLQQIGNKKIDLIIAFGGGSSIDLGKAISAFHNTEKNNQYTINEITDSIKNKNYMEGEFIDIIAVPSTAGTGSEVTQWATIWDEDKTGKFSIDHPRLKPKMAMIVPELTVSVPKEMTLSTGLDAMCQAIEAYWSKHTTPVVQEIAYRAIELVIMNLRKAVDKPDDIHVREKLCRASVLAGLAFSQTRTTACHSISYPLTLLYGVPHGLAASITLDAVGQINKDNFPNDQQLFKLFNEYGGIMNWIDMACEGVINMRLSAFGIKEKDIPLIVEDAFTGGRMDNNPVDLSRDDVVNILESVR
ncbi:alcohol dehydrogenase [Natronincola peptidivorans]|uniref:Alcohol dehydrogenase n=1 Tax=Natronincola peptidivorans TaxID=426128 RepID=A0A1I0CPD9_9FIRM|nr:phosphonoacetaldehyde reductase [Natronincola peptidivorans]SET21604.1 alcohol dehydrogenase [Natronincola peptidivorans]